MSAIHETKLHGRLSFPFALYGAMLPERISGFPLHWHDEMEIIYVSSGVMSATIQNDDFVLKSGDIALVQPQMIHAINQFGSEHACYYTILYRFSLLESQSGDLCYQKYLEPLYSQKVLTPRFIPRDSELNRSILPYILQLLKICRSSSNGSEMLIKSCLFGIMHHVCLNCLPTDTEDRYVITLHDKLKKTLEYIRQHYEEKITVEKAAYISNFSASHFSKIFRQLTGTSFAQYVKNYRLEIAGEKLCERDASISETAFACGFNNLSYFTRAFYDKYRVTPSEYKNSKQEGI